MKDSEIEEGNKLITKFKYNGFISTKVTDWIEGFPYHKDWNLLMPIVEKIDETCPQHPEFEDANTGYSCTLFSATNSPWKIENTYETVIKYIKWYNTQKNGN